MDTDALGKNDDEVVNGEDERVIWKEKGHKD